MKIFIIIATFNERDNLKRLVPEIVKNVPETDILIVDDNSPDGTADLVNDMKTSNPRLHLIKRAGKLGYGTAFLEGFTYVLEHGADVIVTMDADFSHDPAEIPAFLEKIDHNDVVIGSRYINGLRILNWPLRRLLLSTFANRYVNLILNMHIKDCTSGFRCYKGSALKRAQYLNVKSRGYAFLVELLYRIKQTGARIIEHPIVYTERREGQSKMSKSLIFESAFRPLLLRIEYLSPHDNVNRNL